MKRVIMGLNKDVYKSIKELMPRACDSIRHYPKEHNMIDVELNDAVIMKVYDREVYLDLGGEKVSFTENSFEIISCR